MGTYANAVDVQTRVPYRTFGQATKPSAADVDGWIGFAEAKLVNTLRSVGLPASYTGEAATVLKEVVVDYAEGRVRRAYAGAGGDGTNQDGKDLLDGFEAVLKDIREAPAYWGGVLGSGNTPDSARRLRSHVLDNTDDKLPADFAPEFERDEVF